ncbi:glycosyltransferase family 2 protein [Helicobacter colisuis]|uniref:glycosyltransferase family 2 protein n=1 Tax=Helicobacter colisuis TaxID=2949739 RepID=UPI002029C103|nr:glycosyltransferase family 2 protein [Helicobacter colisuis]MCL9823475.1 glycosyltransferase [Helicobacter colisuis]
MTNNPKVSVVVPSLNSIQYIHECIDSILNQTLKDIEIICVDAGSTDGTLEVLREYEKNDERLKVIVSDKKSYGYQMNLGIKEAKGEYLGMVESDDYIVPHMYEKLYGIAKDIECEVVKADMMDFWRDDEGKQENKIHLLNWTKKLYKKKSNCKNNIQFLTESNIMNPSGIHSMELIKKHNIQHNETPGASYQDTGFWFQVQVLADSIYFLNEPLYYYRQDNMSSSCNSKSKIYCICEEYDFIERFLESRAMLKNTMFGVLAYLRFGGYYWNLKRLEGENLKEFLYKIAYDFERITQNPLFNKMFFNEYQLSVLNSILQSPISYYHVVINSPTGSAQRVQEQLAYRVGKCLVECKNPFKILFLPYALIKALNEYRFECKVNEIFYGMYPEKKPPKLEKYADYCEALKIKNYLSYRLGLAAIQSPLTFIFRIPKLYLNFRKQRELNAR